MSALESSSAGVRIRNFRRGDEALAYQVCLQTGDAGRDATSMHDDPSALGNIYVGPYLQFEPELALMIEDEQGLCGYCLGALDTRHFFQRYLLEWLPPLQALHAAPTGDWEKWTPTQKLYYEYHHPDVSVPDSLAEYPSHLHIDLLPRIQGKGWGRRMVTELLVRLRDRRSPGVHLGMWASNQRAYLFYRKLGFTELMRSGEGERGSIYLGLRIATG